MYVLTVLDFVGHQRREFRFDQRFRKLIGGTRTQVETQIEQDFPFLPAGCSINLDKVSKESVLANIRAAIPTGWADRKHESRLLGDISLAQFLKDTGLELADVYAGKHSYTELRRTVGFIDGEASENEKPLSRAIGRLLHINDTPRIDFYRKILEQTTPPNTADMSDQERRYLTMLHYGVWSVNPKNVKSLQQGLVAWTIFTPISLATRDRNPDERVQRSGENAIPGT